MPQTLSATDSTQEPKFALTYWNRIEPRPRAAEIADTLSASVRDPLWMLTRQWQFGEFRGEDASSPSFVEVTVRTFPIVGWRPGGTQALTPIDAPLEELVATEGFTPDVATRVEVGLLFAQRLEDQGLDAPTVSAILTAFRADYPIDIRDVSLDDSEAQRFLGVCLKRAVDGIDLAEAHVAGVQLPASAEVTNNAIAIRASLDQLVDDVAATLGTVGGSDGAAWRSDQLEYQAEVVAALAGGDGVVLGADPDRDAVFEWYAFDALQETQVPQGMRVEPAVTKFSCFPTHVRFRGMPNPRWWDFERGATDFGAVTPDRTDLAKLVMMDFMLIHNNDYFVIPLEIEVGTICEISQLLVHDVFGEITRVERADAAETGTSSRWTCFSIVRTDLDGAPAGFFLLPPSAGSVRIAGEAIEDVRFVRDEQANYAWAIEHLTQGGDGRPWLGHERSVAESARELIPTPPATDAPLQYILQTFVPRHWFPLLPVAIDPLSGETAFELGQMVRPDGTTPDPRGRVLRPLGATPYRIREESIPRVGVRVLREPVRSRWALGETHLWLARRRLAGRGEGSSGLRYDRAIVVPPKAAP